MISFTIANVPTLFIKAFTSRDVSIILEFVRDASMQKSTLDNVILFTDTPVTTAIVEAVERLVDEGYRVVFRDHHALERPAANDREKQVQQATARLQKLLGDDCVITKRSIHPACSTLIEVGEFKEAIAIVADPDADGLTAAMKAAGIYYPELDEDAAKLDSEPSVQVTGSPLSQLLSKNLAILPSFDAAHPHLREQTQEKVFRSWVAAAQGDSKALAKLEEGAVDYEVAATQAAKMAAQAKEVAPGVFLVDAVDAPTFDAGTLTVLLEQLPGCRITALRKNRGPIAALHGIQYSLAVAKEYQDKIDLKLLVPPDAKNDPQVGIISNVSFLLHVSEDIWFEQTLPGLDKLTS